MPIVLPVNYTPSATQQAQTIEERLASAHRGSVPGIVIGSFLATAVPEIVLRPALASMLLVVGSRMVV